MTPRFDPEGSRKSFGTGAVRHSLSNPSPGRVQGPSGSQEKPQEGPTRGPRGPQEGPKRGPKREPKRGPACRAQARRRGPTPPGGYNGPKGAPDQPKTAQEGPKRRPREPQDGHEGPDRPQDGPQDGQEPQIILKTALKWKRRTLWTPRCQKKSRSPGGPRGLRRTLRIPDVHPAKREESTSGSDVLPEARSAKASS